jgi:hypothetical protein
MLYELKVLLSFYMMYGSVLCCVLWDNEVSFETKERVRSHPIQYVQELILSS